MASTDLRALEAPLRTLILCFTLWKISLLLIAASSPGPGYDTSTNLLLLNLQSVEKKKLPSWVQYLIGKLIRWDALYFVHASNQGYVYEQEWAFGWGFTRMIKFSTIVFGVATTFRSNALLNGLLLLEEAFRTLVSLGNGSNINTFRRLIITGLGGICVGIGFLTPQYIAYQEYCGATGVEDTRTWCKNTIPSVYSFVQAYYWNNGPFKYWTMSNIPLFILAMPMIIILGVSGNAGLRNAHFQQIFSATSVTSEKELGKRLLL
ncbi:hypothetical protein SS1G_00153 [Sclerotinia sclerotiorum 1980 UF-70]|uniref:GPI mannosyltransferase 2 n=1 Tax=Sclerotinia sclerotiorum (strain ATCC 18683 / 1980 / Ss-1) TaxID=665079 RepID=A7E4D1_SCLS1|nr:hypothetical protein SS1G_00153 [Sclerotinia sclerotiorum 1980 UF-70]EDN90753.1 hypothetical protein SS1G_00153 [Sclerotinia sclerotiorum 1980 UF-70]